MVKPELLVSVARRTLSAELNDRAAEVSLVLTDQETLRHLNRQYRDIDRATDVLAFALTESRDGSDFVPPPDGVRHLGEVIVSYPQAEAQAKEHAHDVTRELALLVTHGVLHLLGFDHMRAGDAAAMETRERAVLEQFFGPAPPHTLPC
ncbi:MAG: rRNA maturation RNase YbeY [Chloroflexi bacterium]|nr:rRNA maturation RNase YbeY [Chloroflexota bacterium]